MSFLLFLTTINSDWTKTWEFCSTGNLKRTRFHANGKLKYSETSGNTTDTSKLSDHRKELNHMSKSTEC